MVIYGNICFLLEGEPFVHTNRKPMTPLTETVFSGGSRAVIQTLRQAGGRGGGAVSKNNFFGPRFGLKLTPTLVPPLALF